MSPTGQIAWRRNHVLKMATAKEAMTEIDVIKKGALWRRMNKKGPRLINVGGSLVPGHSLKPVGASHGTRFQCMRCQGVYWRSGLAATLDLLVMLCGGGMGYGGGDYDGMWCIPHNKVSNSTLG